MFRIVVCSLELLYVVYFKKGRGGVNMLSKRSTARATTQFMYFCLFFFMLLLWFGDLTLKNKHKNVNPETATDGNPFMTKIWGRGGGRVKFINIYMKG